MDEVPSETARFLRNSSYPAPEYPENPIAPTTRSRAAVGGRSSIYPLSLHGLTGFGVIALLISITITAFWNYWINQGNTISFNISIGRWGTEMMPKDGTNSSRTPTSTVYVPTTTFIPVTHTQVSIQTIVFTTTASVTETVTATSVPKPTTKEGHHRQSTLTLWERGSSPTVQCFHGPASKNAKHRYLMRSTKWQRQRTLRDCLENGKRGIRWSGILCGGATWEVETDPCDGGLYSDSRRCWQRCGECLTRAIRDNLEEAECQVDDRGSRCVTRYVDTY